MASIREARVEDVPELVRRMRRADRLELSAAVGLPAAEVILRGLSLPGESWSCFVDGELMAMWGVVLLRDNALCGRTGLGWLLTTEIVDKRPKLFWRLSKMMLAELLDRWSSLENFIDARHTMALRWGRRLGFWLDVPRPFGVSGLPAHRFVVTKELSNV